MRFLFTLMLVFWASLSEAQENRSRKPTAKPSTTPSSSTPSRSPTNMPSNLPSLSPSRLPLNPSYCPSSMPSPMPTTRPTYKPSTPSPTDAPQSAPPSDAPLSVRPSAVPSFKSTRKPNTKRPSSLPSSSAPSTEAPRTPSLEPTQTPIEPSASPSLKPTPLPSEQPSSRPFAPSSTPFSLPTAHPSAAPTGLPLAPSPAPASEGPSAPAPAFGAPASPSVPTVPSVPSAPVTTPVVAPGGDNGPLSGPLPSSSPSPSPSSLHPTSAPTARPSLARPTSMPSSKKPTPNPTARTVTPTKRPITRRPTRPSSAPTAKVNRGFMFISGDDTDYHCAGLPDCYGNPQLNDLMRLVFTEALLLSAIVPSPTVPVVKDVLALGLQSGGTFVYSCEGASAALDAFMYWISLVGSARGVAVTYDIVTEHTEIPLLELAKYRMIYIPSQKAVAQCAAIAEGVFTYTLCDIETALTTRKRDIQRYVNDFGGSIVSLQQSIDPLGRFDPGCSDAYGWFPLRLTSQVREIAAVLPTESLTASIASISNGSLISHEFYHIVFTGPPGFSGLEPLIYDANDTDPYDHPYVLGGANIFLVNTSYPTFAPTGMPTSAPTLAPFVGSNFSVDCFTLPKVCSSAYCPSANFKVEQIVGELSELDLIADTSTLKCAIAYYAGLSPSEVEIRPPARHSDRQFRPLFTAGAFTRVKYSLVFAPGAYGFPSAYDAYTAINRTLTSAVVSGQFTKLLNTLAFNRVFSRVYKVPVFSNEIMFAPFESATPSIQPSWSLSPVRTLNVKNSIGKVFFKNFIAFIVAGGLFALLCSLFLYWFFCKRTRSNPAYSERNSGVIPESEAGDWWGGGKPYRNV